MIARPALVALLAIAFLASACGGHTGPEPSDPSVLQQRIDQLEADLRAATSTTISSSSTTTLGVTTTTSRISATTTTSTSTTTLIAQPPPDTLLEYIADIAASHQVTVAAMEARAVSANDMWEARDTGFGVVRSEFREVATDAEALIPVIEGFPVPARFADAWAGLTAAARRFAEAAAALDPGLAAPDDGTLRRQAVTAVEQAADGFRSAVTAVAEERGAG